MPAGDDLPDDLVHREARRPGGPPAVLGGRVRPHAAAEVGQVAAADGAGPGGQQHMPGREAGGIRGCDLDLLEAEGTAERLCPHGCVLRPARSACTGAVPAAVEWGLW